MSSPKLRPVQTKFLRAPVGTNEPFMLFTSRLKNGARFAAVCRPEELVVTPTIQQIFSRIVHEPVHSNAAGGDIVRTTRRQLLESGVVTGFGALVVPEPVSESVPYRAWAAAYGTIAIGAHFWGIESRHAENRHIENSLPCEEFISHAKYPSDYSIVPTEAPERPYLIIGAGGRLPARQAR